MTFKSFLSIAAAGCLLAACHQASAPAEVAETPEEEAKADSLMVSFGQMRGVEYLNQAADDTTLTTKSAKEDYLHGVQAGMAVVKAGHDVYNRGVFLGLQMAMNMDQFEQDYGVKLPANSFIKGLREALDSDSIGDPSKIQGEFYQLMADFNASKEARDKAAATESLAAYAEQHKLAKITDYLYGNVAKSDAEKIKEGDKVKIVSKITTADGKEIKAPMPQEMTVGQRMKDHPVNDALLALASGETGSFATSAHSLFGQRCSQLDLKPTDIVIMEMTPTIVKIETPAPAPKKAVKKAPAKKKRR